VRPHVPPHLPWYALRPFRCALRELGILRAGSLCFPTWTGSHSSPELSSRGFHVDLSSLFQAIEHVLWPM
jgi:hypothetical protein